MANASAHHAAGSSHRHRLWVPALGDSVLCSTVAVLAIPCIRGSRYHAAWLRHVLSLLEQPGGPNGAITSQDHHEALNREMHVLGHRSDGVGGSSRRWSGEANDAAIFLISRPSPGAII